MNENKEIMSDNNELKKISDNGELIKNNIFFINYLKIKYASGVICEHKINCI